MRPSSQSVQPNIIPPLQKPPIVLIHGFRGSPIGLKTLAIDLEQAGYNVFLPAIPPFAGAKMPSDYTAENYAGYLASYIREHQLYRPILVGHSMGSIIAAATASYYPALLHNQLILLSPISSKTAKPFALISPLSAVAPRKVVDYVTTRYLFIPKDRPLFRETLDLTHSCTKDQPPKKSELSAAAYFSTHNSVADFSINKNILILAGDRDRLVRKNKTIALADQLEATLRFIPNSGHLHNYEKPHETAKLILDFIAPNSDD